MNIFIIVYDLIKMKYSEAPFYVCFFVLSILRIVFGGGGGVGVSYLYEMRS